LRTDEDDTALARATRARDALLARATFWDRWRAVLTGPFILLGAALGYGAGLLLRLLAHFPERTEFYAAVVGILAVGRGVASYFDVRRLEAARRRVESLSSRSSARDEPRSR
jgi:hypothetical protein